VTAPAPLKTAAKPSLIHVNWVGGHRFDAGRPNGAIARIDGEGETGQSPPETLLSALATCVSYDVIDILSKQRTPIESLEIAILDLLEKLPPSEHYERTILDELRQLIGSERREQNISKFEMLYVRPPAPRRRRAAAR